MIALSYRGQIDTEMYSRIWYPTHTCPGMQLGCEHHPEFAASKELGSECYNPNNDAKAWVLKYEKEFRNTPSKMKALKDLVALSDSGVWIQLLFYEKTSDVSEGSALYRMLKEFTDDVVLTY